MINSLKHKIKHYSTLVIMRIVLVLWVGLGNFGTA